MAAVTITTVLTLISVSMVDASTEPPAEDPPAETQEDASTAAPPVTMTVVVVPDTQEPPPDEIGTGTSVDDTTQTEHVTSTVQVDDAISIAPTSNPNQVNQDQTAVVTGTVVADANTGSNTEVDEQPGQGGSQQPAEVDTGNASAVGSDDENVVAQGAEIVLRDQAQANLLQIALILNIGVAMANSGFNVVGSGPGGSGTSGAIGSGDASATGLDIDQYITQAARENGDDETDVHATQVAISLWIGLATANSGANGIVGTGVSGGGGSVGSGNASATGNDSLTDIEQYAELLGVDQSTLNVTQRATVLNVGFALATAASMTYHKSPAVC